MSERSTKSRKPKPTSPPANAIPISSPNPAPQPSLVILMARKSSLLKQALILVLLLLALYAFFTSFLKYPGHQHMAEWYLFADLNRHESERARAGSPVSRVTDPAEADLFYLPVFSSPSLIVNQGRPPGTDPAYSDEEMQEELVKWWEGQEYWKRNNGRDHVIIA